MIKSAKRLLILSLMGLSLPTLSGAEEPLSSFNILSARQRGVFNIGSSRGDIRLVPDAGFKKDVIEFNYSAPAGSMVGVWTKSYPAELNPAAVNAVTVKFKSADSIRGSGETSLSLELKGSKAVQRIPFQLQAGWKSVLEFIDWDAIGDFKEAVFVVSPAAGKHAEGKLHLDLDFVKKARPKKSASASFGVKDAGERGIFNIGDARGGAVLSYDEAVKRDVLEFDYSAFPGSVIGVWTKGYPAQLNSSSVNALKIAVKAASARQVHRISAALEIKGSKAVQKIPLRLRPGWTSTQEFIQWSAIGDLKEAVFVVVPTGGSKPETGTLVLDLEFAKVNSLQKNGFAAIPSTFSIFDSDQRGAFSMGASKGGISLIYDESLKEDVIKFDYVSPSGSPMGVWSKGYASELSSSTVNMAQIAVKLSDPRQAEQVEVALELKGSLGIQSIPLRLGLGWNRFEDPIDWEIVGKLEEAVFVVTPLAAEKTTAGTLYFNLNFIKANILDDAGPAEGAPSSVDLMEAGERGAFSVGGAQGRISRAYDQAARKDVLKLDYSADIGTAVNVWTRKFSSKLLSGSMNAIRIGVKSSGDESGKVLAKVEIRGTRATQKISLRLGRDWNFVQDLIDWKKIGRLREVVLAVNPVGQQAKGTLHFQARFFSLSKLTEFVTSPEGKAILIFLASMALGLMTSAVAKALCRFRRSEAPGSLGGGASSAIFAPVSVFTRDLIFGASAVLAVGSALTIYLLGTMSSFDAGFGFLAPGLAGAVIAGLLKYALTKKQLTPFEIFQNIFIAGLLAASSSDHVLLQPPAAWRDILLTSNLTAALAFVIYHAANAGALAASGKHIRPESGALIAGTPYLFGWLLLLEKDQLLQGLGNISTAGLLASHPGLRAFLGSVLVVFVFNEIFAAAIGLASKGKILRSPKAHAATFLISLAVCLAPKIADLGSGAAVANAIPALRSIAAILAAVFSQAGLWGEVYFITGLVLDAVGGKAVSAGSITANINTGAKKGMAYSGMIMLLLQGANLLVGNHYYDAMVAAYPLFMGIFLGAMVFPLFKTIIETFDGSQSFFERAAYNYKNPVLFARGAVSGFGMAYAATHGMFQNGTAGRLEFGLGVGLAASAGVSFIRDAVYSMGRRGRIQAWRIYFVDALLGGFIGGASAFYLDGAQVPVILAKFKLYNSAGLAAQEYSVYPLLSKWGRIDLGSFSGGAKLLFNESLAGVISWSVAAWLFAINRAFMQAFFQKDREPIRHLFSKAGFMDLTQHMIYVLRWGLWMSPIINTFLRMMGTATWYNQDGAIRTVVAIFRNFTLTPAEFQTWSLNLFVALLSFDAIRILIWLDHMGLRVATLVNLSFIGMDKLDDRIARFIGPSAAQRYIPEAVKRFTTWAPLLIPFYIPRGEAWDYAWSKSLAVQNARQENALASAVLSLGTLEIILLAASAVVLFSVISFMARLALRRLDLKRANDFELGNMEYRVVLRRDGAGSSQITQKGYEVSRRSYDTLDPCGRILFIADASQKPESASRAWPVMGNFPKEMFPASRLERADGGLRIVNQNNGIRATVDITLPEAYATAEIWTVTVENLTDQPRSLKVVPYLEWVLDRADADRGHTQYARLFPEMEFVSGANAVFTWQKNTKSLGILASEASPEGFQVSRLDFIGRARSIWSPRILETLNFLPARDTPPYPTFDPIGSLSVDAALSPKSSRTIRFMIGSAKSKSVALELVGKHLKPQPAKQATGPGIEKKSPLIGHGEIFPGTPRPYYEFLDGGNRLSVKTPYTPRPYDHAMSNALGHSVMVTNRGLHTSSNGNSQQNRLTPDWPDLVTREIPGEAFYIYDPEQKEWYSPTHHPLNDTRAKNEADFGVDGTAVFRMTRGDLSTELAVFVPPREPVGVYILKIKNDSDRERNLRVASYFQIVLAGQPEWSGPLGIARDAGLNAVFFENPRNTFRSGPAFVSSSVPAESVATERGRFFGQGRSVAHPSMVEKGVAETETSDRRPIAGSVASVQVPARGETSIVVVLGQADNRRQASDIIRKYKNLDAAQKSMEETRGWWLKLMGTLRVKSNHADFDMLQNWLKYQAVAERLWPRRGFYQTSGAFGFRDQLQDSVNLIWVDPALARKQIILHSSQQFVEGDVVHWFHTLYDGRTAFSNRSHASDNLLWLAWAASEYVKLSGDETVLDELTSYLQADNPFPPLPRNKHGWGTIYLRSARNDTVYRHCMKAIDLVLEKRMGAHGLPLIGTGDWNDGLDEIGSEGRGESVWLGFFLDYILKNMLPIIEKKDGRARRDYYAARLRDLEQAVEKTWRGDRYLRAIHDDGTEIGVKDSGVWEIDALTAAWAVISGINPDRGETVFNTALRVLEKENVILLGWPALREDTKPYLGRSSHYPEGVRENGMYCHGDQWLVQAARLLAERYGEKGDRAKSEEYRAIAYRLWLKISPISHTAPNEIEIYGGQPNKQAADLLTTFDQGRMIWHGYTGAAGWMLRQAFESVIGARLSANAVVLPKDLNEPRGGLRISSIQRDVSASPLE